MAAYQHEVCVAFNVGAGAGRTIATASGQRSRQVCGGYVQVHIPESGGQGRIVADASRCVSIVGKVEELLAGERR